jgi:hypothetical protein
MAPDSSGAFSLSNAIQKCQKKSGYIFIFSYLRNKAICDKKASKKK